MATNWPTSRDTFTNPTSGDTLDSPSHAAQHANINDAVEAMQAHAGLVLVKPTSAVNGTVGANGAVTIGTTVSSVTVTNAFSSTFDNYRIVMSDVTPSTNADISFQLAASGVAATTTYGRVIIGATLATNASQISCLTHAAGTSMPFTSVNATNQRHGTIMDVLSPYKAQFTTFMNHGFWQQRTDVMAVGCNGSHNVATSYDGFVLTAGAGTITGGTIRVYGYNNG